MIQNYFDNVKRILGSLISNARAREGWGKGIYLFPSLKIGGSPAKRAKAGGQKGRGFRGRNFCPPATISGGVPAALRAAINFVQNRFGFGSINAPVSNFRLFCPAFRRREAPPYTGKLARRVERGSPNRGSYLLRFLSICFAQLKTNKTILWTTNFSYMPANQQM